MYRSPFKKKSRQTCRFRKLGNWAAGYHTGEDYVCDTDRALVSPYDGVIIASGWADGYGNRIIIRTKDNKVLLMAHMKEKPILPQGASVKAGQAVGIMGASGGNWGAHLHIEVQNSRTWKYNKNLLKPSNYIDFNNFGKQDKPVESEDEEMRYKTINDVPEAYKKAVQRRIDCGALVGDGKGNINVYESAAWQWTIDDRMNPFYANLDDVPKYWREDTAQLMRLGKIVGDDKNEVGKYRQELSAIIAACR